MHSAGIQPSRLRVLALRFSALAPLSDGDGNLLHGLAGATRRYPPFRDLGTAGMPPRMIVAGWGALYRRLASGQRQIVGLKLPGDFVWPLAQLPLPSSCAAAALTELQTVDAQPLVEASTGPGHPTLARTLRVMAHLDHVLLVEQIVRLGRQTAVERLAHLMLELHERLDRVGLADQGCFAMPLAPEVLADGLGLSVVHVNRAIQQLRRDGLLEVRNDRVVLMRRERLQALAGWTPPAGLPAPGETVPGFAGQGPLDP